MIQINDNYIGCFENPINSTINNFICTQSNVMVPDFCMKYCFSRGTSFCIFSAYTLVRMS